MRRFTMMMGAMLVVSCLSAQDLWNLARPVPAAVCTEASMPEEMAQKFARAKTEREAKFITPTQSAKMTVGSDLERKKSSLLTKGEQTYQIAYNASDRYMIYNPNYRLLNTSHGREAIKGSDGKFNIAKDRLSYAVLQNNSEICIVNREHKLVDMSAFSFTTTSEAIRMEGNKIVLNVPVIAIARGEYPLQHKITCTHDASGASYTFDLQMSWNKQLKLSGQKGAYALTPLHSDAADNLGLLCDLEDKQLMVVELPLYIAADGYDGVNGRKGRYGANGTNQRTYTDSNGNTRTTAGTCAKPGEDGQDGQDGTDGGRFLFCVSPELIEAYGLEGLVATIDAGKGGKGGKGGEGGIHGKGSGCNGKAADGKDGRDGKDGQKGDFLYVLTDVNTLYQQIFQ